MARSRSDRVLSFQIVRPAALTAMVPQMIGGDVGRLCVGCKRKMQIWDQGKVRGSVMGK